jgi:hypothetical protein
MLDLSKRIGVQYISGGLKTVMVRWPTDAEWCDRNRKHRIISRQLGRDKSESSGYGLDEANAELLQRIAVEPIEADPAEATEIISRLESLRVVESSINGDRVAVRLRAMGEDLNHELKIPTARQKSEYFKASMRLLVVKGGREYRQQLEPSGSLYDALVLKAEGYSGPVPIVHKDAALSAMFGEMDSLLADDAEGEWQTPGASPSGN